MITLSTQFHQPDSDLEVRVATPDDGLIIVPTDRSIDDLKESCTEALSKISEIANTDDLNSKVELGEARASKILKSLAPLGEEVLGREALERVTDLIRSYGNGAFTVVVNDDLWIPWELMHELDSDVVPAYVDFWGCKYRIYRRFPTNPGSGPDLAAKIQVRHERPQIAVLPYDQPGEAPVDMHNREIPYLMYLQTEEMARFQQVPGEYRPESWDENFRFLCKWLREDDSEIVHFAGLLSFANEEELDLVLKNRFSISAQDLTAAARAQGLNLEEAPRVAVLNARCDGEREPKNVLPVISALLGLGVRGVVASVHPVPDVFAAAFVEKFYRYFLFGHEIGEALSEAKRLFVREFNNPLALFYSPFVNIQNPALQLHTPETEEVEVMPEESVFLPVRKSDSTPQGKNSSEHATATILHLSDLHCGPKSRFAPTKYDLDFPGHDVPDLHTTLLRDIERLDVSPDVVAISGDLTHSGTIEQFSWARDSIESLVEALDVPSDNVIVVPGNHDIKWMNDKDKLLPAHDAMSAYRSFYELLYGDKPSVESIAFKVALIEDKNIVLVGLNSCLIEDRKTAGIGYIGHAQLNRALGELQKLTAGREDCVKVAVLHHHLLPVEPIKHLPSRGESFSLVVDASSTIRRLYQEGFSAVFHGHQHQPYCLDVRLHLKGVDRQSSMAVIGAGSLGASREDLGTIARNHYSIIQIMTSARDAEVRVIGRQSSDQDELEFIELCDLRFQLGGNIGLLK